MTKHVTLPHCVILRENLSHTLTCLRMFWPKEIWGLHGEALADFKDPGNASQAVQCLNQMVTDALRLRPHCTLCGVMTCVPAKKYAHCKCSALQCIPLLLCFCVTHKSIPVHRCSLYWYTSSTSLLTSLECWLFAPRLLPFRSTVLHCTMQPSPMRVLLLVPTTRVTMRTNLEV